mmetsp:Transcript_24668/g.97881  ORF Transcript_24668/g.97881 Transcript_24668/m.97881 type:complete len:1448 (-) Transcript_24668:96-4439(-)
MMAQSRRRIFVLSGVVATAAALVSHHPGVRVGARRAGVPHLRSATLEPPPNDSVSPKAKNTAPQRRPSAQTKRVVLISGFESFNQALYARSAESASTTRADLDISVFSDRDLLTEAGRTRVDAALAQADAVVASLLFDYDDVEWLRPRAERVGGPRLVFECAAELMSLNRVGSFEIKTSSSDTSEAGGAPAVVKTLLKTFGSGREEDRLAAYLSFLKRGPELLKFFPGDRARDVRTWLELYRFWNEGGEENVASMFGLLYDRLLRGAPTLSDDDDPVATTRPEDVVVPALVEFPAVGVVHPAAPGRVFASPNEFLRWRRDELLERRRDGAASSTSLHPKKLSPLADSSAPVVAVLVYRKHVLTKQPYVAQLCEQFEKEGLQTIPVFITGVEAHTVVRDLLTSRSERLAGVPRVDAVVNAIGFPLVGGPAGSMKAGRDATAAADILGRLDVPYVVAAPLLLQTLTDWQRSGVSGLQSVVLYALPELDGATDAVVLGGLAGDTVAVVPERARRLARRLKRRIALRETPVAEKKVAVVVYGYPPNVGAVGTAALLNVPRSLDGLFEAVGLSEESRRLGEAVVAALTLLSTPNYVNDYRGAPERLLRAARRATTDPTIPSALADLLAEEADAFRPGVAIVSQASDRETLALSKTMREKMDARWPVEGRATTSRPPGTAPDGALVVNGVLLEDRVFVAAQPLLGFEGDPMGILFGAGGSAQEKARLAPHPQYVTFYETLDRDYDAVVHLGTHGTSEWLPGQALGNDARSWSDVVLRDAPNFYVYANNNPSEALLAKRRGYATLVSHLTPPYARSGLYLDLANLKALLDEYLSSSGSSSDDDARDEILALADKTGLLTDVGAWTSENDEPFGSWAAKLATYLAQVQNRLFSSGLRVLGHVPDAEETRAYIDACFPDLEAHAWTDETLRTVVAPAVHAETPVEHTHNPVVAWLQKNLRPPPGISAQEVEDEALAGPRLLASRLRACGTDELANLVRGLEGGFVPSGLGGDVLRDGVDVLPTGRNAHALDPYRMPSESAWRRGLAIADAVIRKHQATVDPEGYPETVAVSLWGLDAIKTRGESVAVAVALAGGRPVRDGTGGRVVRFDLVPLDELRRPRIDVLASLSGIFRDAFDNVVLLLDDFFRKCADADEPPEMNFVRKHVLEYGDGDQGDDSAKARLFSNPPGDYGSTVDSMITKAEWDDNAQLGETWARRNAVAYGRGGADSSGADRSGSAVATERPAVLESLLATTDRVVQEIDSVEYGLTDIQEYHANLGALVVAAESSRKKRRGSSSTEEDARVAVDVVEAFGDKKKRGSSSSEDHEDAVEVKDLDATLRLEYRSKLLNPKWAAQMVAQGSGGAYEVSQRFTAMIGWGATVGGVDDFVFDQAAERYALDDAMATRLRQLNPEAFKNVVARLLEANARGFWTNVDEDVLDKLRDLYADADDFVEGIAG